MKKQTPQFILGLGRKKGVKAIALVLLFAIGYWQVKPSSHVDAASWTDLPTAVTSAPAVYGDLITAHSDVGTAMATMANTQATLNATLSNFNTMQSNLLFKAMDQGAAAGVTFDRITDPSKIVSNDAATLVTTSLADLAGAGVLVPQTLNNPALLSSSTVDLIIESAMKDLGIDPFELKRATGYQEVWVDAGQNGGYWEKQPLPFATAIDDYWAMVNAGRASIANIAGPVSVATAKAAVASALLSTLSGGSMPSICPGEIVNSSSGSCAAGLVPLPGSVADMAALLGGNFDQMYVAGTNEGLRDKIVSNILSATGNFTIAEYKDLLASSVHDITGYANLDAIKAAVGAPSVTAFSTTIKDSIQNEILQQFSVGQSFVSPDSISGAMQAILLDPAKLADASSISSQVETYARTVMQDAIANGGVDVSQIKGLYTMPTTDMQAIIDRAVVDTGLNTIITPAQYTAFQASVLSKFSVSQGTMSATDIKGLIADQMSIASGGVLDAAALTAQLNAGGTGLSITNGIKDAVVNKVLVQMGSASAMLDPAGIKNTVASSMISVTGLGDVTKITDIMTASGAGFNTFTGNLQGIYTGQVGNLTGQMTSMLSPANVENMVAQQMTSLTGLGNVANVQALINNSLGQSLSSVAQIGGQLGAVNQAFGNAFGSMTTSLNSLSGTFNDQLVGMSGLVQSNIAGMSGQLIGMVTNLQTQITGPITAAVNSMIGPVTNTITNGFASAADLGSLAGTSGNLSAVTSSLSGTAGGTASVSGGVSASSGMTLLPIGGFITGVQYCTCSAGNILIWVAGPYPGVYLYMPGATILYPNFQIYRSGPAVLGLSSAASFTCMQIGFPSCWPSGAGRVITQIGTSL